MTIRKTPSTAYKPGQSGNPAGRPKGCRNRATQAVLALMEGAGEEIVRAVVDAAKAGDLTAARMVIDRLAPPAKERPISIDNFPSTETVAGISQAQQIILNEVAIGNLTPGEGATLSGIAEARRKALESEELSERIAQLEKRMAK